MDAPSLDVVFSADWNIFGYDPNGLLAYLVAYFFGPDWLPDTFDHLPHWKGEVKPPRYGPPGPQQAANIPPGWKCTPPPLYYGAPSGPYLPPPRLFRPSAFAGLIRPHARVPLDLVKKETSKTGGEKPLSSGLACPYINSLRHYCQVFVSGTTSEFQSSKRYEVVAIPC